jgi:hypothetical protein
MKIYIMFKLTKLEANELITICDKLSDNINLAANTAALLTCKRIVAAHALKNILLSCGKLTLS